MCAGSMLKASPEVASRVIPRDELDSSIVDFLDSPVGFLAPCFLCIGVNLAVQAFKQCVNQGSASLGRKRERFAQ